MQKGVGGLSADAWARRLFNADDVFPYPIAIHAVEESKVRDVVRSFRFSFAGGTAPPSGIEFGVAQGST